MRRLVFALLCGVPAFAGTPWVIAPAALKGLKNPITKAKRAEASSRGEALYAKECKGCHGAAAKGDGEEAMYFTNRPPDLTTPTVKAQSDEVLFAKLSSGRTDMADFSKKLSEAERWDLVCYLRTLISK